MPAPGLTHRARLIIERIDQSEPTQTREFVLVNHHDGWTAGRYEPGDVFGTGNTAIDAIIDYIQVERAHSQLNHNINRSEHPR